ncbi:hypothetical protein PR048_000555 [Dryococelus australis]|uniref:Uncharacterized protein n=1 Tax=Dryococelus australis TaxID=614101 RepID=A0ABQ9IEY9_9NEOP|nr:hypothetical protein PR048_000555 [Dryococelus australis]
MSLIDHAYSEVPNAADILDLTEAGNVSELEELNDNELVTDCCDSNANASYTTITGENFGDEVGLSTEDVLQLFNDDKVPPKVQDPYILKSRLIFSACTARQNIFYNPPLTDDKQLKEDKKPRSFSEEGLGEDGDVLTKWLDNISVTFASNFVDIGEPGTVRRLDNQNKSFVQIEGQR